MAEYKITPELYYEAVTLGRHRLNRIVAPVVILFLLLVGFLSWPTKGELDLWAFGPAIAFTLLWFFGLPLMQRRQIRRVHAQQKSLQEAIVVHIREDAVTWTTASGSARISWTDLYRWKGNDRLTILYESQALMRIIPHDSLNSDELNLMKQKLENVKKG